MDRPFAYRQTSVCICGTRRRTEGSLGEEASSAKSRCKEPVGYRTAAIMERRACIDEVSTPRSRSRVYCAQFGDSNHQVCSILEILPTLLLTGGPRLAKPT